MLVSLRLTGSFNANLIQHGNKSCASYELDSSMLLDSHLLGQRSAWSAYKLRHSLCIVISFFGSCSIDVEWSQVLNCHMHQEPNNEILTCSSFADTLMQQHNK